MDSPRGARPPALLIACPMDSVRLDKWLWAARFFKTRSLATEAIAGGKVDVNGDRAKPAKAVKPGDQVRLRAGPYEHTLIIRQLAERRGPAAVAQALYEETDASRAERERLAAQLKMAPAAFVYEEKGRPTKKDRRDLTRFIDRKRR
jgi:ribosome-associated heat shock protein Hsp15